MICVALLTVNVVAETPPNRTAVAPAKFVPVIVTELPTAPVAGVKLVMVGAFGLTTVKVPVLVPVPPEVTTEMTPVVAPTGTVAVICVALLTVKVAVGTPLKRT